MSYVGESFAYAFLYLFHFKGDREKWQKYVGSQTACDIIPAVQLLSKTQGILFNVSSLEKD